MEIGLEVLASAGTQELVSAAQDEGYQFALGPMLMQDSSLLLHPLPASLPQALVLTKDPGMMPAFWGEMWLIFNAEQAAFLLGQASGWVDLGTRDQDLRQRSELLLRKQIEWASHIGMRGGVFALPEESVSLANFARLLEDACNHRFLPIYLRLGIQNWREWNMVRMLGNHLPSSKLQLILELDSDTRDGLDQWRGEPVFAVLVSTSVFLSNKTGYPVLSRDHQLFIHSLKVPSIAGA